MYRYEDRPQTRVLAVLLLPGCSPAEVGLLADGVEAANRLGEGELYRLRLLSADGGPVAGRQGRLLTVDGRFDPRDDCDLLLLCAGETPPERTVGDPLLAALVQAADCRRILAGSDAGGFWLAQAGLLNGYRATVHWSRLEAFQARYAQVSVSNRLFEADRDRLTCGGGVAVADLFLYWLAGQYGAELAAAVADHLLIERIRGRDEQQRIPLKNQIGAFQPKLLKAVQLMEVNLEEPLTTDQIAERVCVSRRQLERLFKQYLNSVPSQYYLELRLNKARHKLRHSSESIIQIGLSCGFSSGPHFSSAYRNHFGVTPRDDRRRALLGRGGEGG
ncbi:MAG TPA: GlxA family transcriptional regulator [Candidatus Competibacteraceae bacterium]|nr:GlxA family transcriptional regulator [Candidatus Competibacteraceae bacterium]